MPNQDTTFGPRDNDDDFDSHESDERPYDPLWGFDEGDISDPEEDLYERDWDK